MIKRIELVNFMSHRHTVIEPAAGLTVLTGPNNCGKSAIVTALQILAHNENSTYVTRHEEKQCSITVETDDGHTIEWRRRQNSISYCVDGEIYDRLRGNVPEAVAKALRLSKVTLDQGCDEFDIHFGEQKNPVFLLNKSGRSAAGFFAASSDASRLLEMQKLHGQKVRDATRELNRLEIDATRLQEQIQALRPVTDLQPKFAATQSLQQQIELAEAKSQRLRELRRRILHGLRQTDCLELRAKALAQATPPPALPPTDRLRHCITTMVAQIRLKRRLQQQAGVLLQLNNPPTVHDTRVIRELASSIRNQQSRQSRLGRRMQSLRQLVDPPGFSDTTVLHRLIGQLSAQQRQVRTLQATRQKLQIQSATLDEKIDRFLASDPVCPTCLRPLDREQLLFKARQEPQ